MASISCIQGQLLEVTVVGCNRLKNTEWISRQDPYVCVEYGSTKYRTRTHTDGGKNPVFQQKFVFTLIEGWRDLKVLVWNNNTLSYDNLIGTGMVQLQRVLSQGFDDATWALHSNSGRHAGEVRLIMHYSQANKPATSHGPSATPHVASHSHQVSPYSVPLQSTAPYGHSAASYPAPSPYPAHPPAPAAYPHHPSPYPAYPPAPAAYAPPPSPYPAYPPAPAAYAPPPSAYPPPYPNSNSSYYPPGPYNGAYPPPLY